MPYGVIVLLLQGGELLHHALGDALGTGLSVEVVKLVGVVLEVIEFPCVDVVVEVDELVALVAYAIVTLHRVLGWILVEVVVEGIAPVGALAFEQRQERLAMHLLGHLYTCKVEEGGAVVNVLHELGYITLLATGETNEEGCAERLFVHEALVEPSVLAHIEALVRGVYNHRVLQQTLLLEVVEHDAYIAVYRGNDTQVVAHVLLEFPFGQLFAREVTSLEVGNHGIVVAVPSGLHLGAHALAVHLASPAFVSAVELVLAVGHLEVIYDAHVLGDAHLLLLGSGAAFVVVVEGFGHGEVAVAEEVEVTGVGHPCTVRRLMVQQQAEGLFGVAQAVEPVDGYVGRDIGGVTLALDALAVANEVGVVVFSLSDEDVPVVEARGVRGQVPFAHNCSLIPGLLQQFGEGELRTVEAGAVVDEAIGMAMLAREHTGAAGATDGVGYEAVGEAYALIGYAVNVGRFNVTLVVGTDGLVRVVVAHDEEDVHRLLGCGSLGLLVGSGTGGEAGESQCSQCGQISVACVVFHLVFSKC